MSMIKGEWKVADKKSPLVVYFIAHGSGPQLIQYYAIKAPQWYAVQVSDTTMLIIAASLPGQ